ncbi:MAG TPA: hypothetical protein DGL25_04790, partial [Dehalococcoidia bacterium]|nr:hypothetical protein [Dehalococcoidia bacterium]
MIEKVYGFVIREGEEGLELLVYECPSMPEVGIQVPGGAVQIHETPVQAVARELLEGSGLPLGGWQVAPSFEVEGEYWHCFFTTPEVVLPDAWR